MEEARGELGRLRGRVERAVVGEHLGAQREDLAVRGRGDLAVHVVVARERGGHQVFRPVLHPLHWPAGRHRGGDRAQVARVDGHLGAEAAAQVGRHHPDLVLGHPGDGRVERAWACGAWLGDRQGSACRRPPRSRRWHRRSRAAPDGTAGTSCRSRPPRRPRRTPRRWRPCRRLTSRRCGCRLAGPRGPPARRGRARSARPSAAAAARSRRRSARARPAPRTGPSPPRTRPPGPGSAPCRWPAPPARRRTPSASTPCRVGPGRRR